MKKQIIFVWECLGCGWIEHGKIPPEKCPKCKRRKSFAKLPKEWAEKVKKELIKKHGKELLKKALEEGLGKSKV
ncbi:hypothetical protein B6U80_00425 [Candidatus Pacearchaeota archaeon ex4484_26]|nr:MAG: hypothetical protein B6U80_00425 [Candidatus Pacearchaeota archaeon ex4484_26]RLF34913.1 MAG: hypothetical protein DRM99_05660 [Thermoplasmata archaeon]